MTINNMTDLQLPDSCEDHEHMDDEIIVNTMLEHVFNGANHQMQTALELTKMMIQQNQNAANDIFKTYQDALKTVMESSPIPSLLHLMGAELA